MIKRANWQKTLGSRGLPSTPCSGGPKVRGHYHYKGEYRGAAHSTCNLNYSVPKEILVVFHNRCKNDYLFIIKELVEKF